MAYRIDETTRELVIDGFENGIAHSPYTGIANIRNMNTSYYPGVAYTNYERKSATLSGTNVIDTYSETNFNSSFSLYSGNTLEYVGQPFYNSASDSLGSLKFYLSKTGSPTGNVTASVYAATKNASGQYVQTNNSFTVSALVVGGGGGGSTTSGGNAGEGGGGGGGGKVVTNSSVSVVSQAYTITVGSGGNGNSAGSGGTSSFLSLTAIGGVNAGLNTSGGGASGSGQSPGGGGSGGQGGGGDSSGGSGGGGNNGGNGGSGTASSISGSSVTYGGGGGGGAASTGSAGSGGTGGGGGGGNPGSAGTTGTANTGGGGGGGGGSGGTGGSGANGASGVVIISYPTGSLTATGGTITTSGGNTIHTFTTSGTWTVTSAPTAIATSNNVDISTLTGSNSLVTFTFASPPSLTAKTFYIATVQYTGGDSSDHLNVGYGITSEYMNNVSLYSSNGTFWQVQGSPAVSQLIYYAISSTTILMSNPVQSATSPAGLNYILDANGNVWKQSAVNSSSWSAISNGPGRIGNGAGGLAYWNNYILVFGDGLIEVCGDGTGDSTINSSNWNLNKSISYLGLANQTVGAFTVGTITPTTTSISITAAPSFAIAVGQQVAFYVFSGGTLPSPLIAGQVYYATAGASGSGSFTISATPGGSSISFTTAGSTAAGTVLMAIIPINLPIGNVTNFQFTQQISPGATTGTISTYTTPDGITFGTTWNLPTGIYTIIDQIGDQVQATFTNGSDTVQFLSPTTNYINLVNLNVEILNPNVSFYSPYVSKVDGNLYFANGGWGGSIVLLSPNANVDFSNPNTFETNYATFGLSTSGNSGNDSIVAMTDLSGNLVVAGKSSIYLWDYVSNYTTAPIPVESSISNIINVLNNVYIFAGQKGNIYIFNGSYAELLYKIPDYISGAIDPVWTWGGAMNHRSRVYFQALAQNTSGTYLMAGIFSLIVSPAQLGTLSVGMVMEAQNSYGLIPTGGTTGTGCLIDNEPSSSGQDSYYSAYSTGSSSGWIDYNDTTPWGNFEPTIETDIIPTGSILDKKTFGQFQFKLDRPMIFGDQISVYWRSSLTGSYTLMGTTTTTTLSDYYPSNVSISQWVQFKVTTKCASSGSSFIPIREVRVQLQ